MATMTLDQVTAQLQAAYGPALRAVVLYGSAARAPTAGVPSPAVPRGGYDLLVVVEDLGMEELRRVAPTTRAWTEAGNPPPLTLTMLEWRGSSDVFPMEYADVLASHRVLAGALPLDGISVDASDLRRQLEQQTLGALLQLRGAILASGNDAKRLLALLEASRSTMLVLFRTLARLHGAQAPNDPAALTEWAGRAAGFDAAPFARVVAHAASGEASARRVALAPGDASGVLAGYLIGLERLVGHINTFRVGAGRVDAPPSGAPTNRA